MNHSPSIRKPRLIRNRIAILMALILLGVSAACAAGSPGQSPAPGAVQPSPTQTAPSQVEPSATPPPTNTVEPSPTPAAPEPSPTSEPLAPAGWTTYTSQRCEYGLSFPAEMQVTRDTAYSTTFKFNPADFPEGTPNFIYVSVIDQEYLNLNPEDVYNYAPEEADRLMNLQVGESGTLADLEQFAEYITYTRLPDTILSDQTAMAFENLKPWEFPAGTKEIRYYLDLDGCLYQVGGYMDTTRSEKPGAITEDLFQQVVDTFQARP